MSCKLSLKRKEQKERRSITTYIDVLSCRRGALGFSIFAVLAIFKIAFGFCAKKLRFFGFGVHCGLRIFRILAFGFREKYKRVFGFRIRCGFRFSYLNYLGFRFLFDLSGNYAPPLISNGS